MKISPRRFTVEEFPEQQSWIGNLLSPLNQTISELFSGTTNNITVSENLYQEIKELKFTVDATTYPIKFKTKFNKQPIGMYVMYCRDTLGGSPSASPWADWSFNDGLLTITSLTALTTGKTYVIRLHIVYG